MKKETHERYTRKINREIGRRKEWGKLVQDVRRLTLGESFARGRYNIENWMGHRWR